MKIYFTAAIYQREQLKEEYKTIIKTINDLEHESLTAFDILKKDIKDVLEEDLESSQQYYQHWQKIVNKADMAVIEISFPCTVNIGVEIGLLLEKGKPIICLHTKGRNPVFTSSVLSSRILSLEYNKETIKDVLKWGIEEAEQLLNRRFTFFISPEIEAYLNKISKTQGQSRSEFIRALIEERIRRDI